MSGKMAEPASTFKLSAKEKAYMEDKKSAGLATKFFKLVEDGNTKQVKKWIESKKISINTRVRYEGKEVTPLLVAAETNNFEIIKLLLESGAERLKRPALTTGYKGSMSSQALHIMTYAALSSPAYIILTNEDPILETFQLCKELTELSEMTNIHGLYKEAYLEMVEKLDSFANDLLDTCDCEKEMLTLLHGSGKTKLKVASEAADTDRKKFLTHPKCQHILWTQWVDGQPSWATKTGLGWSLLYFLYCCILYGLLQPILAFIHLSFPSSRITKIVKSPKAKYLMTVFSYLTLLLLLISNYLIDPSDSIYLAEAIRVLTIIWLVGMLWAEIQQAIAHGFYSYVGDFWNFMDIAVLVAFIFSNLSTYIMDQGLFNYVYFQITICTLATLFTVLCIRIMEFLYVHPQLGAMLLTFTRMTSDVLRFLCLLVCVVLAFSFGMFVLYQTENEYAQQGAGKMNAFHNTETSFRELLWSIFGRTSMDELTLDLDLNNARIRNKTLSNDTIEEITQSLSITSSAGHVMYLLFCLLTLLVLLNICIAMMSDTYTRIKDNIDTEWRFVRSTKWLDYIKGPVIQPPYNLVPTPAGIYGIFRRMCRCCRKGNQKPLEEETKIDTEDGEVRNLTYEELIRVLCARYIQQKDETFNIDILHDNQDEDTKM